MIVVIAKFRLAEIRLRPFSEAPEFRGCFSRLERIFWDGTKITLNMYLLNNSGLCCNKYFWSPLRTAITAKLLLLTKADLISVICPGVKSWFLCADHVISKGRRMTNLVSNFECLFWFFQQTLKWDLKEVQFTKKSSLLSQGTLIISWRYPKFQNLAAVKKT